MNGIFARIAAGEMPSWKVAETDQFFAFLDINPLAEGHTLVIPKIEVDYIFDLDDELYSGLFSFAAHVARAIGRVVPCKKVGIAVVGLEVPHAHIHLVPLNKISDLDFSRPKCSFSPEEFRHTALKIAGELSTL